MKPLGWINRAWVLAIILGLAGASCMAHKSAILLKDKELPHKQQTKTLTSTEPDAATKAKVQAAYGKLPLHFEVNQGQTDGQVKFLSRGSGYSLFLTSTEAVLALHKLHKNSIAQQPDQSSLSPPPSAGEGEGGGVVLRMKLVGANPAPQATGLDELPGKSNYFIGNDPQQWHTNIPTYARVQYQDIYPGIDLVYYGNQQQLEYDFVVAPGADPKAIKLAFDGIVGAGLKPASTIDTNGDLILHTEGGEIRLHKPRIYQEINGVKQPIPGGYVLLSPQSSSLITFHVAAYDTTKPLIIDPVLIYSTYLGGSGDDKGFEIAVDSAGNAYVAGQTTSTNFPTTSGAFDASLNGSSDFFVTKLNPSGSALVYSTYLGGSGSEGGGGQGMAVDSAGNAYVTGDTTSTNFPTTLGAFQTAFAGGADDAIVTKLDATGSALVYSTYLGGSSGDAGGGIAVDSAGNAYVAGTTISTNFPTVNPFQASKAGGVFDAFVTKLNATGSALVYSTYLGGSGSDNGSRIEVDSTGNAYVAGATQSTNFPTTSGAFQTAFGGGDDDVFITKLNATGSALVYSTYLGGSGSGGPEGVSGLKVDSAGNAYVTGETRSTNFPTTSGAFQTAVGGGRDAYVTKLNTTGSALVYSTYLGGSGTDVGGKIAIDPAGNAYVVGSTDSTNFPTSNPFQPASGGGSDAFVTKLNPSGSALVYSTYLGGSGFEEGAGLAVDSAGNAYVTGRTASTNFPTTSGAFQTTFGGSSDAFVAKIGEPVVVSTPGTVNLGGFIDSAGNLVNPSELILQNSPSAGGKASFGGNVQFLSGDPNPTGNLRHIDHVTGDDIKATSFSLLIIGDGTCGLKTHAMFTGKATVNGVSDQDFQVDVDDCGEPGSAPVAGPDMLMIMVTGPNEFYLNGGLLVGGNIQVKPQ